MGRFKLNGENDAKVLARREARANCHSGKHVPSASGIACIHCGKLMVPPLQQAEAEIAMNISKLRE